MLLAMTIIWLVMIIIWLIMLDSIGILIFSFLVLILIFSFSFLISLSTPLSTSLTPPLQSGAREEKTSSASPITKGGWERSSFVSFQLYKGRRWGGITSSASPFTKVGKGKR